MQRFSISYTTTKGQTLTEDVVASSSSTACAALMQRQPNWTIVNVVQLDKFTDTRTTLETSNYPQNPLFG